MSGNGSNNEAQRTFDVPVTITVDVDGSPSRELICRFHTPTMLDEVKRLPDGCRVRLEVPDFSDGAEAGKKRKIAEGPRDEVADAVSKSIVPPRGIEEELRKVVQFLFDHSDLVGIGVHALYAEGGSDGGFGFVTTAPSCTQQQAVALVNCGEANIDEFVSKTKISVPGRSSGGIVAPTDEQIRQMG